MEKLEISSVKTSKILSYHFQFKSFGGWAILNIDENTGQVSLQSDWGDYSYRWGSIGKQTLEEFVAGVFVKSPGYAVNKFRMENPNLNQILDEAVTLKLLKDKVKAEVLCPDDTEDLLEEIDGFDFDSMDLLYNSLHGCEFFNGFDPYELGDFIQMRNPHRYDFLKEQLLPTIGKWLSENALGKED